MPVNRKGKSMEKGKGKETLGVLGLGTPEVRRWVDAGDLDREEDILEGRREGRRVGFAEPEPEALNEIQIQSIEVLRSGKDQDRLAPGGETEEATIKMRVQISPRRPALGSTNLAPAHHTSPLRNFSQSGTGAGDGHTATNPAHDLLHTLIKDALYDFRRETKSEIIGLHLDLVRMGRGWKKEMREAMDQWSSDLKEVREENTRLRGENERLRRGY
ncbi:hypothetical protein PHLCEN_2v9133 [Hermanssonia centrifuga]|uniref:Uncharacterized protein n=1 Tax=Hermanssonia centrifuga TaxID=98765 RepID=A0A2R6NRI7_9APHY|nr:hypothetical protein PHLCEN_2v9133 [Hermanssonia centrifuga]